MLSNQVLFRKEMVLNVLSSSIGSITLEKRQEIYSDSSENTDKQLTSTKKSFLFGGELSLF